MNETVILSYMEWTGRIVKEVDRAAWERFAGHHVTGSHGGSTKNDRAFRKRVQKRRKAKGYK